MQKEYPTLSLKERDRRWNLTHEFMKAKGLDCLLVMGLNSSEQYDNYLANDSQRGIVIFPQRGEPTYLAASNMYIISTMEDLIRGGTTWIEDWRGGVTSVVIVSVLKEKGLESATIGVIGTKGKGLISDPEGHIPYQTWTAVLESLPNANFVDVSEPFVEMSLVKSEEELELIRYVGHVGELGCQTMMDVMKPGVSESEVYSAIIKTLFAHGASVKGLNLLSGVENLSWGYPKWIGKAQRPRNVQKGEIILVEMCPHYGYVQTQQQMTVALKPVDPINQECADAARSSLELGLEALRPGKTFKEVCDAMEEPIAEAGLWHLTPMIHSINTMQMVSYRQMGMRDHLPKTDLPGIDKYDMSRWERHVPYKGTTTRPLIGGNLVIKKGMTFALEPNACRGRHRVNIGPSVIVADDGVEVLNQLPNEMQIVG